MTTPIDRVYAEGERAWFEYHCYESADSNDADLWYRSHQQVTVTGREENDAPGSTSFRERCDNATPWTYGVLFEDGHRGTAIEDELMDSPDEFYRPDPPREEAS